MLLCWQINRFVALSPIMYFTRVSRMSGGGNLRNQIDVRVSVNQGVLEAEMPTLVLAISDVCPQPPPPSASSYVTHVFCVNIHKHAYSADYIVGPGKTCTPHENTPEQLKYGIFPNTELIHIDLHSCCFALVSNNINCPFPPCVS